MGSISLSRLISAFYLFFLIITSCVSKIWAGQLHLPIASGLFQIVFKLNYIKKKSYKIPKKKFNLVQGLPSIIIK